MANISSLFTDVLSDNQFTDLFNNADAYSNLVQAYSQKIWDREDSAVQRLVEDYKKAGLNPSLIGGATTGSQTSTVNPAMDKMNSLIATFDNYLGYANSVRQYFGTGSQIANDTWNSVLKAAKIVTGILTGGFSLLM